MVSSTYTGQQHNKLMTELLAQKQVLNSQLLQLNKTIYNLKQIIDKQTRAEMTLFRGDK